jgi:hypothetical protein
MILSDILDKIDLDASLRRAEGRKPPDSSAGYLLVLRKWSRSRTPDFAIDPPETHGTIRGLTPPARLVDVPRLASSGRRTAAAATR